MPYAAITDDAHPDRRRRSHEKSDRIGVRGVGRRHRNPNWTFRFTGEEQQKFKFDELSASDLLCRACFEALPRIGHPVCARCGMPTAFETFVCEECKGVDFSVESAQAPLRYIGVGKEIVHSLKYVATRGSSKNWPCL